MSLTPEQKAEIAAATAETPTRRPTAPGLEARLAEPIPVLDHGFIRVVDYMGDDAAIVQAARVSYGAGTKTARDDAGLIRYLMRHWHSTPFEMCEIKLHVKLPVFVARQWIRHRTANVNEYSARYSILDREFYIPAPEHLAAQSRVNNQGRGETLEGAEAARVLDMLRADADTAYDHYQAMLSQDGQQGLARELARMNLPANVYTQWYWKVDLHNLFHFLRLRADPHAQYRDPRLRRGALRGGPRLGARRLRRLRGLPAERGAVLGEGDGGAQADACGRDGDARGCGYERGGVAGV